METSVDYDAGLLRLPASLGHLNFCSKRRAWAGHHETDQGRMTGRFMGQPCCLKHDRALTVSARTLAGIQSDKDNLKLQLHLAFCYHQLQTQPSFGFRSHWVDTVAECHRSVAGACRRPTYSCPLSRVYMRSYKGDRPQGVFMVY